MQVCDGSCIEWRKMGSWFSSMKSSSIDACIEVTGSTKEWREGEWVGLNLFLSYRPLERTEGHMNTLVHYCESMS